jgi:hypothetical protein
LRFKFCPLVFGTTSKRKYRIVFFLTNALFDFFFSTNKLSYSRYNGSTLLAVGASSAYYSVSRICCGNGLENGDGLPSEKVGVGEGECESNLSNAYTQWVTHVVLIKVRF